MDKPMVVNTNLGIIDYVSVVNELALEYFNEDGEYQPQIGILNEMRVFYNVCVKESKFDDTVSHDIVDALELETLVSDEEFIDAFNKALIGEHDRVALDFANAHENAMSIVENRKTSIWGLGNSIKKILNDVIEKIAPVFSEDNIKNIEQIAKDIAAGNLTAEAIVDAYSKSQRLTDVVNSVPKESTHNNVVKF